MLGFLVDNLSTSQLSYLLTTQGNDVVFYQRNEYPLIQKVYTSILPMMEAIHHKGTLIATDLDSANFLRKIVSPMRKLYYPWFVGESLRYPNDYMYSSAIFTSPELEIIARSKDYARQLEILGCDVKAIIEDCSFTGFNKYIQEHTYKRPYFNEEKIMKCLV